MMKSSEAYYQLTRVWTNMHHSERMALTRDKQLYADVMALAQRGMREEATEAVVVLITDAGQTWRKEQGKRFITNSLRLAPHGGCNWSGCSECFPSF